ncbi:hypothetical protein ACFORG_10970 [Lutimaribacter marinistellae]|uniref:Transcription elongation factor n=1 Tax=Lutimaribacter marinistellae TaxID=1820329 RepID=A0ABV7TGD5_9RHOB
MTDRAAKKKAVHARLMSLEESELAAAIAHYEAYMADSHLSDRETHDNDDMAIARENADLAHAFEAPVQTHHGKIDAIENTDWSLSDTVGPGAVVSFGGRNFVVCVSTQRFEVDGETYMGISTQSPIYQAMAGLKEGETFTHNGKDVEIESVL